MYLLMKRTNNPPRIALVGNLANVAYQTTKFLRRKGIHADVFISDDDMESATSNPCNHDLELQYEKPDWVKYYSVTRESQGIQKYTTKAWMKIHKSFLLLRQLRKYDLIESFCITPMWIRAIGRPYISFATGSDLRELATENSRAGKITAKVFKNARVVFFGPDPEHMERVRSLKLYRSYPYRQIIDTETYCPTFAYRERLNQEDLVIFHPTRHDWYPRGTARNLRGLKGNDKLLKAFARYVKEGRKGKMILLDRGSDATKSKQLINEMGIERHVKFLPEMDKKQLRHCYNEADIVADQFCAGSFGLITLEAMSCGRPVLVDIDTKAMNLFYEEFPTVLNCNTETEIYQQLLKASDRNYRERIGKEARHWILKYHHWEKVIDKLIWHYETIIGEKIV